MYGYLGRYGHSISMGLGDFKYNSLNPMPPIQSVPGALSQGEK